ncbi:uncharacterized protein TNCV_1799921 [Trichonephila clavipes]|nr:uncharacterized protein TNCV_1799921 [Trichonephila clavipes]
MASLDHQSIPPTNLGRVDEEMVSPDILILSDSRSFTQHLSEWQRYGDRKTTGIVHHLNCLSANVKIFFQWVPSHVNVCEKDIADDLACENSFKDSTHGGYLTFSEIATRVKQDIGSSWRQSPVHKWYEGNHPGAALDGKSRARDEPLLLRFAVDILELNGMWRVLKFSLLVRIAM